MPVEDPYNPGLYLPGMLLEDESGLYGQDSYLTWVVWRDILLGPRSSGNLYCLRTLEGWEELPPYQTQKVSVGGGHGTLVAPIQFDERAVIVSGWCSERSARNQLVQTFMRAAAPSGSGALQTESLQVTHAGVTLSADARVVRASATAEAGWALGRFGWVVQWLCNDPRRYGQQVSQQSFLALPGAGLALPASLPAAFAANPVGGMFSVENVGTADAPARYVLTGPLANPGVMVNAGTVNQVAVQYALSLADGESLVIDTRDGGAGFLNGGYRSPASGSGLTSDLVIRPGLNSVQALGVASAGSPGSSISVTFRPAYW